MQCDNENVLCGVLKFGSCFKIVRQIWKKFSEFCIFVYVVYPFTMKAKIAAISSYTVFIILFSYTENLPLKHFCFNNRLALQDFSVYIWALEYKHRLWAYRIKNAKKTSKLISTTIK